MATSERLTEYNRKRDFGKTKEPPGKGDRSRRKALGFFVQKHAATRLHYDLRLEWDGTLLSWAVTKGPSADPGQKRLAVRTEDHPLSYAEFEGTIPKKEYGGGTVMLWDRGRWLPRGDTDDALKKGKLSFSVDGERMLGGWTLVRMKPRKRGDRENWLLIKERDEYAGHDPDELVKAYTTSISTSRTMDQIARDEKPPARKAGRQVTLERAPGQGLKTREEYHGVRISNPHRIVYPKQGITKVELAHYYDAVATRMLPHVVNRPLSLLRCPKGRGDECFFQKHASAGYPDSLMHVNIREKSGKRADYLYVDGIKGIVAAVQMGTLEFHIWGSRIDALEKPDRLVFDLDPDETLDFGVVRLAAVVLRRRLERLGLKTVPLVTGGKGVHVIAPLRRTADWTQVKAFAKAFATKLASDEPDVFTATMSKSRRRGRIFVDWLRNERGSTAIAPYSTRARENGPVAKPVGWRELEDLESANCFRIDDVIKRMQGKDPWDKSKSWRQSITAKLLETVSTD